MNTILFIGGFLDGVLVKTNDKVAGHLGLASEDNFKTLYTPFVLHSNVILYLYVEAGEKFCFELLLEIYSKYHKKGE